MKQRGAFIQLFYLNGHNAVEVVRVYCGNKRLQRGTYSGKNEHDLGKNEETCDHLFLLKLLRNNKAGLFQIHCITQEVLLVIWIYQKQQTSRLCA